MISKKIKLDELEDQFKDHASTYSGRYFTEPVPKNSMPEHGMPANAAYQLIRDELNMDGNPALNTASFVTTWMEDNANKLIMENIHKNFIDHDEYPQTEIIHERMVNMLARLYNSPSGCRSIGTCTVGSSEAIMLAGLAHKFAWRARRKAAGLDYSKPNIIFGADTQICWDKFARYFDVELRLVPLHKNHYIVDAQSIRERIDENTICVGAVVGTTFTGELDPVSEINDMLLELKAEKGWDIPLHVDGASGGFVIPFTEPELKWDFRLEQVKSINVSGHKYGLVYPGIGWVVFRDEKDFPEELIFKVNYLGGDMPTYTLNFSRGSAMVLAQYYNFLRLGYNGYQRIMCNMLSNARYLAGKFAGSGKFEVINKCEHMPIIAIKLRDEIDSYSVFDLSPKLRERGWIVPAYTMPPNAQDVSLLRVVVKENFSCDMADMLYEDTMKACRFFEENKNFPRRTNGPHKHKIC